MKNILLVVIAFSSTIGIYAQKIKAKNGQEHNQEFRLPSLGGIIRIDGNPYLLQTGSAYVSQGSIIFQIKENMNLGEGIPLSTNFESKGTVSIQNIIVNKGKTILFYRIWEGKTIRIYFVELDQKGVIKWEKSAEVMQFKQNAVNAHIENDFTVRQSPDGSKILLSSGYTDMTFKVYSSGMDKLLWEKSLTAPAVWNGMGGDHDRYNTEKDQNDIWDNRLLINNEGRVFLVGDVAKKKIPFLSVDPTDKHVKITEMDEPGFITGTRFFRLSDNGNANFFFFYPPLHSKEELKAEHGNKSLDRIITANPNGFRVVEYDGDEIKVLSEHLFNNAERSLFFPEIIRESDKLCLNKDFALSHIVAAPSGETVMVLEMGKGPDGFSYGIICTIVLDKELKIKSIFSFMRMSTYLFSNSTSYEESKDGKAANRCAVSFMNDNLHLMFYNDKGSLQVASFNNLETVKINDLGGQYSTNENVVLNSAAMVDDKLVVPVIKFMAFRVLSIQPE